MDIVVASDSAYAVPLNACVSSVVRQCPGCHVHVLDCGLSDEDRRLLAETVGRTSRLSFVTVPPADLVGLPEATCGSVATYGRLFVDVIGDAERVVYLDADTIVMSSLLPLFRLNLAGAVAAAVREMYTPVVSAQNGVPDWQGLGFEAEDPYFNAGVMVIDVPRWKSNSVRARCLDYLRATGPLVQLFDQEALNVALHNAWIELPAVWNVTRYWYKESRRTGTNVNILDDAAIVHFISEEKPWLSSDVVPAALSAKFFEALDRSSLAGWRPPPRPRSKA